MTGFVVEGHLLAIFVHALIPVLHLWSKSHGDKESYSLCCFAILTLFLEFPYYYSKKGILRSDMTSPYRHDCNNLQLFVRKKPPQSYRCIWTAALCPIAPLSGRFCRCEVRYGGGCSHTRVGTLAELLETDTDGNRYEGESGELRMQEHRCPRTDKVLCGAEGEWKTVLWSASRGFDTKLTPARSQPQRRSFRRWYVKGVELSRSWLWSVKKSSRGVDLWN